jgi:hypothetical protein
VRATIATAAAADPARSELPKSAFARLRQRGSWNETIGRSSGTAGDSFLEGPTIRADGEMRLEEDGFEVRELMVGAQRQLLAGLRTLGRQYRPLSHPTFRRAE